MMKFLFLSFLFCVLTFGFSLSLQATSATVQPTQKLEKVLSIQEKAPTSWGKMLQSAKEKASQLKEIFSPLKPMRKAAYLRVGLILLVVGLVLELVDGIVFRGNSLPFLGYIGPIFLAVGLIFCVLWFIA
ncbi:MAG: hypothetical protein ACKVTZ_20090 [Bacteroidia bacterium]